MSHCAVHLHSLGQEHNLGLKSFNQYPSPRPLAPQQRETCRLTLPIGTPAEGRHTYTQHTPWQLKKKLSRACEWECSALTYSVLQCPGIMPGLTGIGIFLFIIKSRTKSTETYKLSGLCLQGWNKPWPRYGLWLWLSQHQNVFTLDFTGAKDDEDGSDN